MICMRKYICVTIINFSYLCIIIRIRCWIWRATVRVSVPSWVGDWRWRLTCVTRRHHCSASFSSRPAVPSRRVCDVISVWWDGRTDGRRVDTRQKTSSSRCRRRMKTGARHGATRRMAGVELEEQHSPMHFRRGAIESHTQVYWRINCTAVVGVSPSTTVRHAATGIYRYVQATARARHQENQDHFYSPTTWLNTFVYGCLSCLPRLLRASDKQAKREH